MATVNPTTTVIDRIYGEVYLISWVGIVTGDTVTAAEFPAFADRSVQITGTFGGATAVLTGSNDGTNYVTLTDPQGNNISKTSAALEQVQEITRYIKPATSGGTGDSINFYVVCSGQRNK